MSSRTPGSTSRTPYRPERPSPLAESSTDDTDGYDADTSPEDRNVASSSNRMPTDKVISTGNRLRHVTAGGNSDQDRYRNLSPLDQRRRVGIANTSTTHSHEDGPFTPSNQTTPTPAGRREQQPVNLLSSMTPGITNGQRQRMEAQQRQEENSGLAMLQNAFIQLQSRVAVLESDCSQYRKRIQSLEQEKAERDQRIAAGERSDDELTAEKRGVARMVKNAVKVLYGETKVTVSHTGDDNEDDDDEDADDGEMRWNYLESSTSKHNHKQNQKVISLLQNQRESIPMPADIPRNTVPLYTDALDLFHDAIQQHFRQNQAAYKKIAIKEWGTEGGPREQLLAEIERQKAEIEAGGGDDDQLAILNDTLKKNDAAFAKQSKDKPNVRSKLTAAVERMEARRAKTSYRADEYEGLESVYWIPPPYAEIVDGEYKWYHSDWEGTYSQQFIDMHKLVWDVKLLPQGRRKPTANGPVIDPSPPGPRRKVQLYLPSSAPWLHECPQRWQFRPEWLADEANADIVESRIVPVDQPTSYADVQRLEWYLQHPWKTLKGKGAKGKGKKAATEKAANNKRARSESTQAATTDSEAPSGQAVASASSSSSALINRGRSAQPANKTIKKAKFTHDPSANEGREDSEPIDSGMSSPFEQMSQFRPDQSSTDRMMMGMNSQMMGTNNPMMGGGAGGMDSQPTARLSDIQGGPMQFTGNQPMFSGMQPMSGNVFGGGGFDHQFMMQQMGYVPQARQPGHSQQQQQQYNAMYGQQQPPSQQQNFSMNQNGGYLSGQQRTGN
ncbi:hypothetical protein FFLO_06882 [Filobasidium floriforme]|uniref:Uncharacterized protein n=1 Tax=Filobasidium floriforme TaxID=5210 RepID=A0A8K0NML2_9TREE|nr:uncharacterized protein HD553DRAFT_341078 [Filobasidium floriforme]KAG7527485.1 hypothetical protein FFLO_06882 [Filobasidium floriforme]KAH8087099.1 hypothetical protein HD553DRAFT_341078 [Filobasidium floriforme]